MLLNPMSNKEINDTYIKCLKLEEETYNIKIKKLKPYQISIECENQFEYLATHQYSITLTYDEFCKLGKTFRLSDNIDEIFDTIKNLFKGVDFTFKNDNTIHQSNSMQMQNMGMNNQIQNMNNMMGNMNNNMRNNMIGNMGNMNNNLWNMGNINMNNMNNMMGNMNNNNMGNMNNQINQFSNNSNQGINSNNDPNAKLERSTNGSIVLILKIPLLNEKYENIKIELKKESKDIKKQFEKLKNKFLKIKKIAFSDETEGNNNMSMNNNMNQGNFNNMNNNMNQGNFNNMNNMQSMPAIKPTPQTILNQIKNEFRSTSQIKCSYFNLINNNNNFQLKKIINTYRIFN